MKKRYILLFVTAIAYLHNSRCDTNFVFSASASSSIKSTSMPALGRPFNLGDLYDRKRDVIIQGPKLWTHEETQKYAQTKTHGTNFEVSSSESINEKMTKLDISANLKTSFMSGMVEVSGSAAYLRDKKRKNNQARVSLKYTSTVYKRTLLPALFTRVSYPDVLRTTSATDVVVAIQYGAGAVFVFDKNIEENESRSSIEGSLEIAVRNIPSFGIEGSGKVKITEEQRKKMEKFSCKFHGDFVLKEHPGNYEEAIVVYKALPGMLGEAHQNAVPVKVWLYPIDKLPLSTHTVKVRELEENLLTQVTERLEMMEDFVRQCNDMIDTQVASNHVRIKKNVMNLKSKIEEYIIVFKEQMADLVPKIRDGSKLSGDLAKILEAKEKSPFNEVQLQKLISHYAEEVNVLTTIQKLPNYCRNDGEFSAKLINNRQYMIGLVMRFSKHNDDYLEAMDQFLSTRQVKIPDISQRKKWWQAGSLILRELQRLSYILETYHSLEETKEKHGLQSNVQFYVREQAIEEDESTASVFLELYENGKLKEAKFDIPGESGKPTFESVTHNQIKLKWSKPTMASDRVVSFSVSTYVLNNTLGQTPCNHRMCLLDKISTVFLLSSFHKRSVRENSGQSHE